MALSFAVKVKLSTFSVFSFVKLWRELRMRRAFDHCEAAAWKRNARVNDPVQMLTAIKRKNLRHFRSFRALTFESVQKFTSAKFV